MKADKVNPQHFVLDPKGAGDIRAKIKQDPQAGLKQAAQQFEGMLLQMMLKSMRDATPQDGMFNTDQTRFFTGIMDQQLAQNLSVQGKLGFAKLLEQQLGRNLPSAGVSSDTPTMDILQQALIARQTSANIAAQTAVPGSESTAFAVRGATSTPSTGLPASSRDFVERVWPQAAEASASTGVPAQFLVAHAALESGWGKSEIRRADGSPSHNLFGIKAGRSWQGATTEVQTTEYVSGVAQSTREKFRVYNSYAEAFRDYANLLGNNSRFSKVLGQQDGTQFALSLQQSGYATDPRYAEKLSSIISGPTLRQAMIG